MLVVRVSSFLLTILQVLSRFMMVNATLNALEGFENWRIYYPDLISGYVPKGKIKKTKTTFGSKKTHRGDAIIIRFINDVSLYPLQLAKFKSYMIICVAHDLFYVIMV